MRPGMMFICSLALLGGCAGLVTSPPPDTYALSPAPVIGGEASPRRQILIAEPLALKAYDSEQIVIHPTPSSIQYLANSQWSDRLPRIVQGKLVEAFENSNKVGGVGRPGDGLAIDFQIVTTIRAFEVRVENGREQAVVVLSAKLLNDRNGIVADARVFRSADPVKGSGNAAYVRALDHAFEEVLAELVPWALARF